MRDKCSKVKYAAYKTALAVGLKFYKRYKEVQTPYFCRKCDAFHLTQKRANAQELAEVLWYKKGQVLRSPNPVLLK